MDNITHSFLGLGVAEAYLSIRKPKATKAEAVGIRLISVAANNLPDADLLYARFLHPQLGYLVHHRGHTHTIVFAIFAALAVGFLFRRFLQNKAHLSFKEIAGLTVFGGCFHIFADSWNSYGVHPFWPIDSRWFYGDLLFIIEPALWVLFTLLFLQLYQARRVRILLGGFLVFTTGLCVKSGFIPLKLVLFAVLFSSVFWIFLKSTKRKIAATWVAVICLLMAFNLTSMSVKNSIRAQTKALFPSDKLVDIALTPSPLNPWCWQFITASTRGDEYFLRKGSTVLAPDWIRQQNCSDLRTNGNLAPLQKLTVIQENGMTWRTQYTGRVSQLQSLSKDYCEVREFLKFARAPFWIPEQNIIGDLRFDRSDTLGFAKHRYAKNDCKHLNAPWETPVAAALLK